MKKFLNKALLRKGGLMAFFLVCYGTGVHFFNQKIIKEEAKQKTIDRDYNDMLRLAEQSDSILLAAITEIYYLDGKIESFAKTKNKAEADSLTKEYTKQQYEIFAKAKEAVRNNRQQIFEIAKQNNIKLNIER